MVERLLKKVEFPPTGKYVLAVSGGLDSICLLDIFAQKRGYKLVVAHFDHGMRSDSAKDRRFVTQVSNKYGLPFIFKQAKLGRVSEAKARTARYQWLDQVKKRHRAEGVITAHHLDDTMETAIFNAGRGAERFGLTPLHLQNQVIRPLLNLGRADLLKYAKSRGLSWREDPSNQDLRLARNFIRHRLLPLVNRQKFAKAIQELASANRRRAAELEAQLTELATQTSQRIEFPRQPLLEMEETDLANLLYWAVRKLGGQLEARSLSLLIHFARLTKQGQLDLANQLRAYVDYDILSLVKQRSRRPARAGLII